MKKVLSIYWREFNVAYLDDIIVWFGNVQERLVHLALVFEKLDFNGITYNPKKCLKTDARARCIIAYTSS